LYGNLASDDPANAWPNFQNAINRLPNGVTNDDPFNGLSQQSQMPRVSQQIAANLPTALPAVRSSAPAICKPGSKRLLPPQKTAKRSKTA
jgi:hypothetical protein